MDSDTFITLLGCSVFLVGCMVEMAKNTRQSLEKRLKILVDKNRPHGLL